MKKFYLLVGLVIAFCLGHSQQVLPTDNLLLGYQEFPTSITGHAADAQGNQYFTGVFRGQLTANKQVLATGNGLEDIFWVKMSGSGQVLRSKTFGTPNSEGAYTNSLAMGSNRMIFGISTYEPLSLGSTTLTPYPSGSSQAFAAGLVCLDTAGTVLWSQRTNLQSFRVYAAGNIFHVFGNVMPSWPAIKYGDVTALDSTGRAGIAHLMIDTSGNLLGTKFIASRNAAQGITLYNVSFFSDNSLFLQLRADGDSSFQLHKTAVQLPGQVANYHVFVRTDTSYTNIKTKILNPLRHSMAGLGNQWLPACVGLGDSVYTVFCHEASTVPFTLDGFSQTALRNTLYVMDGSLTVKRQVFLGPSSAGYYPLTAYKRRVFFRQMLVQNGQMYLNGVSIGVNESPFNAIPTKDTTIALLPGLNITVDQNGPSKSFMARCRLDGSGGAVNWYGAHSEYENMNVSPAFLHPAGPTGLAFVQTVDNTWNPWMIDTNLNVVSGSMRKSSDMPELPQLIRFFPDGSRIVLGLAKGKTAFDTASSIPTNARRSDVFLVRLRANNQVAWYKRFYSTLTGVDVRGLEVRNDKAYFLVSYVGSQNDSNYIQAGNSYFNTRTNASLLASVDTAGKLVLLNLPNDTLRAAFLMQFSFFSNGDLAVITDMNAVAYRGFPQSMGQQIFRLNASSGSIIEGRKIVGSSFPFLHNLRIDNSDRLYLTGSSSNLTPYTLSLHDGIGAIDAIQIPAGSNSQLTVLKMDWNHFQWLKRFSGNAMIHQNGDLALLAGKPVVAVLSQALAQPMLWDGQIIHNGSATQQIHSLLRLNDDGSLAQKKLLPNTLVNSIRVGNGQLYVSGLFRAAMQIDTIQVGFAGSTSDGLGLVLDTALVAKRSFRVGSPYVEVLYDLDIFRDSLVALAYTGQTTPQVYVNRMAVAAGDYEQDAYVGTLSMKTSVVTGLSSSLPAQHAVSIAPNPVTSRVMELLVTTPDRLPSTFTIYQSNGQYVTGAVLQLAPGTQRYTLTLPPTAGKGVYCVVISNKRWTTTRTFLVL